MKRNLVYWGLVFALLFLWLTAGALTQYLTGGAVGETLKFVFGFSFAMSAVVAAIFFVVLRAIRNKFFGGAGEDSFTPSRKFAAVASTLLTVCVAGSVMQSQNNVRVSSGCEWLPSKKSREKEESKRSDGASGPPGNDIKRERGERNYKCDCFV